MKFVQATLLIVTTVVTHSHLVAQTPGPRSLCRAGISPNKAPVINSFAASTSRVIVPCPQGQISNSGSCPPGLTSSIRLLTNATDPDGHTMLYIYGATGGSFTGEGPNVTWDLSGLDPRTYTASVEVDDGLGCVSFSSTTVTIALCDDCVPVCVLCPPLSVTCPDFVDEGQPATFTANLTQGTPAISETYHWKVSAGTITSGQATSSIVVDAVGTGGASITATVEVSGDIDPSCNRTASCTVAVRSRIIGDPFDRYGNIRFNDEKARLDNFAIQLQNSPTDRGVMIGYGSCEGEAHARLKRAKNSLVKTRGIEASRIDLVDSGCRAELAVVLWLVPEGATTPEADRLPEVSPCPRCRKPLRGSRR